MRVSIFKNVLNPRPLDHIPVTSLVEQIRSGKWKAGIIAVRDAKNKETYDQAKKRLPAATFSGTFSRRAKDGLIEHSGLIALDVDDVDIFEVAEQLRSNPHVYHFHVSAGGSGLRVLVRTEPIPTDAAQHEQAFHAVIRHFDWLGADASLKDVSRLAFVSYDSGCYLNDETEPIHVDYQVRPKKRDRLREGVTVLRDGEKYTTLRTAAGALRYFGFAPDIINTMCQAARVEHGESPGEAEPIERLASDSAGWEVGVDVDLRTFVANVIKGTNGHANGPRSVQSAQSAPCTEVRTDILPPTRPWVSFPTHLHPAPVAEYVRSAALALGCDEAMIGVAALPVLAAAIGNSYRVELKSSWTEPAILWAAVIQRSGTMKSPALEKALAPINLLELEMRDEYLERMELYEAEQSEYDARSKTDRKKVEAPIKPSRRRYRVSDTTVESIAFVHAENPRGLLLARDELAGFLGSFDRYNRGGADMQSYIEMYDGRFVQIDRKTSKPPVMDIRYPAVSIVGTSQPKVFFEDKITPAHFESGFLQRWLIVYPPEQPRRWTDADIDPGVKSRYFDLVRRLSDLPFHGEPQRTGLSRGAKDLFKNFCDGNADLIYSLPEGALRSSLSKIEAIAARLALIFHLCEGGEASPVSRDTMQRAIWMGEWFRYELTRIYDTQGLHERSISRDERLAAELPATFTWKDVASLWGVKKRAAYKIISRLIDKKLAEDAGHGKFARCTVHSGHFAHSVHVDPPNIPKDVGPSVNAQNRGSVHAGFPR